MELERKLQSEIKSRFLASDALALNGLEEPGKGPKGRVRGMPEQRRETSGAGGLAATTKRREWSRRIAA